MATNVKNKNTGTMERRKKEKKWDMKVSPSISEIEDGTTPSGSKADPPRFSDEDLKEFKELILAKLEASTSEMKLLKESLSLNDNNGIKDTSPGSDLSEDGGDALYKEEIAAQMNRLQKYIEHLKNALIRIENKTYGICSATGKLISKQRLKSVPHSTLSIDAKLESLGNNT